MKLSPVKSKTRQPAIDKCNQTQCHITKVKVKIFVLRNDILFTNWYQRFDFISLLSFENFVKSAIIGNKTSILFTKYWIYIIRYCTYITKYRIYMTRFFLKAFLLYVFHSVCILEQSSSFTKRVFWVFFIYWILLFYIRYIQCLYIAACDRHDLNEATRFYMLGKELSLP